MYLTLSTFLRDPLKAIGSVPTTWDFVTIRSTQHFTSRQSWLCNNQNMYFQSP